MFWRKRCTHTDQIREGVVPSAEGCEECLRMGARGCTRVSACFAGT